jgi:type I restriction enzyme, S subunit
MTEWKEYKLKDLGLLQRGRSRHRPRYAFHLYGGKYPFVQTGQIREASKFITKYEQTYSEDGLKQSKLWPKGTLCITIAANIAELAILDFDACFPDSVLGFIPNNEISDLNFIYYTLTHFQRELKHIGEGSVQDNINLGTFEDLLFPIPPLPEQAAIASVLSSLDDKIDLLHRQNATLEKMAETLFRQMMSEQDFNRLQDGQDEKNKKSCQSKNHENHVQDKVEEAKEDWEEGKLSDLVIVKYGKDHKKLLDGKIPVYGSGGLMRYADKSLYEKESVLIPRKGTLNNVMYQDEPFWTVDTMFYTEMKIPNVAKFIYHFLKEQDLASMNVGSAVPSMTTEILNNMPLNIPSKEVFEKFEGTVAPLYAKTKSNQTQIRTLTALRDTLLPKLMSGEVKVEI